MRCGLVAGPWKAVSSEDRLRTSADRVGATTEVGSARVMENCSQETTGGSACAVDWLRVRGRLYRAMIA